VIAAIVRRSTEPGHTPLRRPAQISAVFEARPQAGRPMALSASGLAC
jgi:hypothetical protein